MIWSNTPEEGGRILGEGVHFFDLCNWFMGEEPLSLSAAFTGTETVIDPDLTVQIRYPGGSIAQVLYTAVGEPSNGQRILRGLWKWPSRAL